MSKRSGGSMSTSMKVVTITLVAITRMVARSRTADTVPPAPQIDLTVVKLPLLLDRGPKSKKPDQSVRDKKNEE